jgi:hypothetical protein
MTPDDGETGVRRDDSDLPPDTQLWKKINDETEMLRRRTTPMHVQQAIMSALPDPPAKTQQAAGASKISPGVVGAIVIALLILGLLLGMVLRVQ